MEKIFINNWATQLRTIPETTYKLLDRVKNREKKLAKKGWRWIKVNARTTLFLECDKDGNPTPASQKKIDALNKV